MVNFLNISVFFWGGGEKLTSCLKIKPETPATSSARNTKVKNMAYCRKHTKTNNHTGSRVRGTLQGDLLHTSPTSLSIHGLPRHVAKHPKSPKITMMAPVPMRTYGALVLSSDAREK